MRSGQILPLLAAMLLLPGMVFSGEDLFLRNGDKIPDATIVSKNQYGINILDHVDKETGNDILRHIRFSDLSPASLKAYPHADIKTNERIVAALRDRFELIEKKHKDKFGELVKENDFSKNLSVPGGINTLKVFFKTLKMFENGSTGWVCSDSQDSILYGIIFLYGIRINPGDEWIADIYPGQKNISIEGKTYPVFTVFPNRNTPETEADKK